MLSIALDVLYQNDSRRAGDMAMVDRWKDLGFVVKTTRTVTDRKGDRNEITAVCRAGTCRYDGRSYRDCFYYLLNVEKYPDIVPFAKTLARTFLTRGEGIHRGTRPQRP